MVEKLMTFKETMEYLNIKASTLYTLVQGGIIPASKVGRQWRFKKGEIDNWLREQRVAYNRRTKQES